MSRSPLYHISFYPRPLVLGPVALFGNPIILPDIEKNNQTDDEVQPAACFVLREDEATPGTKTGRVPARVSKLSREVVVASTGPPARQRVRNIYVTLGSGTYVVMCAAFKVGMEGSFKVRYRDCFNIGVPNNRKLPSGIIQEHCEYVRSFRTLECKMFAYACRCSSACLMGQYTRYKLVGSL